MDSPCGKLYSIRMKDDNPLSPPLVRGTILISLFKRGSHTNPPPGEPETKLRGFFSIIKEKADRNETLKLRKMEGTTPYRKLNLQLAF